MNDLDISLFPIPGSVSLPKSIIPLHIFEPRYRKMIKDSIEQKRRIGVAHTLRVISPAKINHNTTLEEQLGSNQETYEAYPIFSAGFAEILETLPDGRLIVQIKMDSRYEIVKEIQQIPYKIVRSIAYLDEVPNITDQTLSHHSIEKMRRHLDQLFIDLGPDHAQKEIMEKYVTGEEWSRLSLEDYSFAIYSLVVFPPDVLQKVLELRSSAARISFLTDALSEKFLQ
ncbi:MAG: LON peptidase substrate-binding domain-containing protein [Bacteriovorax sp.]|nr:LON peptidase substrate-binding domain-containing protein [Bacteriovorax sp.]